MEFSNASTLAPAITSTFSPPFQKWKAGTELQKEKHRESETRLSLNVHGYTQNHASGEAQGTKIHADQCQKKIACAEHHMQLKRIMKTLFQILAHGEAHCVQDDDFT
jgi:hypothetical protein